MPLTLNPVFGDFDFSAAGCDIETWDDGMETRGASSPVPRSNIAAARDGLLSPRPILARGIIGGTGWTSRDDLRTAEDAFKYAMRPGYRMLYRDSDRYCMAEVKSLTLPGDSGLLFIPFSLRFEASDPYWYATTEDSDTWAAPVTLDTHSVTNGGSATAAPKFTFTFGSTATLALTLTDTSLDSPDNSFTLATPTAVTSGDILEVDCLNQTVIYTPVAGTPAYRSDFFDGTFFELDPGANLLSLTFTGPTLTSVVSAWRKRYL